jgi:hypothetical protein
VTLAGAVEVAVLAAAGVTPLVAVLPEARVVITETWRWPAAVCTTRVVPALACSWLDASI